MYVIEVFKDLLKSDFEHFHEEIGFAGGLLWILLVKSVWVPTWVNESIEPTMFIVIFCHFL